MASFGEHAQTLVERLGLALSRRQVIRGISVYLFVDPDQEDGALRRVREALDCLARFDPRRLERFRKDVRLIWVRRLAGTVGQYNIQLRACQLDHKYVLKPEATRELIASTIVHEGTHARIQNAGIAYTPSLTPRIERACRAAELAFANRLPNGEQVIDKVRRWQTVPDEYWDHAAMRRRDWKARLDVLEELEMPRWIVKTLRRVVAWRRARSRRAA